MVQPKHLRMTNKALIDNVIDGQLVSYWLHYNLNVGKLSVRRESVLTTWPSEGGRFGRGADADAEAVVDPRVW